MRERSEYLNNLPLLLKDINEVFEEKLQITPFDVQIEAAKKLVDGKILEMYTGEGKSVVNVIAALIKVLQEQDCKSVHIYTSNNYLAKRDYEEFKTIFEAFDVRLELLVEDTQEEDKYESYKGEVVYTDSHSIGFDYLRQNLNKDIAKGNYYLTEDLNHSFAIIDEVDSILLDKGNTPLIISNASDASKELNKVDKFVTKLSLEKHYTIDKNNVLLTVEGIKLLEDRMMLGDSLFSKNNRELVANLMNSLKAHYLMKKDVDYIVEKGHVVNIDQMTGRKHADQKYSDGLHQAIEVKEGLDVTSLTNTNAVTTIQSHFMLYGDFGGLTGTAITAKKEFKEIFGKKVAVIDRRLPLLRVDRTEAFLTKQESLDKLLSLVTMFNKEEHPVLIGCQSIAESEEVAKVLRKHKFKINLLNAKTLENEAEMIMDAGKVGAITVATNIAGRGTDIKLEDKTKPLTVIGYGLSTSPRIDLQLRGRSGRQGDHGFSVILASLEDDFIVKNIAPDRVQMVKTLVQNYINTLSEDERKEYSSESLVVNKLLKFQKFFDEEQSEARCEAAFFDSILSKHRNDYYDVKRHKVSEHYKSIIGQQHDGDDEEVTEVALRDSFKDLEAMDIKYKSHLDYFNNIKKTISLAAYNGVDKKIEFQTQLQEHYKKVLNEVVIKGL